MGVLNVTPDSFSDGGRYFSVEAAVARAEALVREGADLLDVGAESTRPRAQPVSADEEWARLAPVLRVLDGLAVPISVDTYKSEVADAALRAGAELVNDVSGGQLDPRIREVCAEHQAVMIVSHLRGRPATMQEGIAFADVFEEVADELAVAVAAARAAGVTQVIADPGIGFGKTAAQSVTLIARAGDLGERLGVPVLIGPSRKSFLRVVTAHLSSVKRAGDEAEEKTRAAADDRARAAGTTGDIDELAHATDGAVVSGALCGASFVRVHDAAAARLALAVADAVAAERGVVHRSNRGRGA